MIRIPQKVHSVMLLTIENDLMLLIRQVACEYIARRDISSSLQSKTVAGQGMFLLFLQYNNFDMLCF